MTKSVQQLNFDDMSIGELIDNLNEHGIIIVDKEKMEERILAMGFGLDTIIEIGENNNG